MPMNSIAGERFIISDLREVRRRVFVGFSRK
jgi:hypothetical protein